MIRKKKVRQSLTCKVPPLPCTSCLAFDPRERPLKFCTPGGRITPLNGVECIDMGVPNGLKNFFVCSSPVILYFDSRPSVMHHLKRSSFSTIWGCAQRKKQQNRNLMLANSLITDFMRKIFFSTRLITYSQFRTLLFKNVTNLRQTLLLCRLNYVEL